MGKKEKYVVIFWGPRLMLHCGHYHDIVKLQTILDIYAKSKQNKRDEPKAGGRESASKS